MLFKKYLIIFSIFYVYLSANDITIQKEPKPLNEVFTTIGPNAEIKNMLDVYDNNDGVLDLKSLLEKAKDNYTLQGKNIAIKEAEATRDSVIGSYIPSLDIGYSFNSTKSYINSWNKAFNAHQAQASANWVIFDGASREFSLLSNNALVRAAIADKGYSQESVFLQVISYYYQYFSIKGQIIAMEQKKVNIAANVARVQVLYDAGLEPLDSLEALKAELSSTEYQLESLRLDFEQTKLQLSLFTNTNIDKLKLNEIKKPEEKEIQSLNITMQEEQALSVEYQIGTLTYWPTISLFDTYYWNFKNNALDVYGTQESSFSMEQHPRHQNVFGLSITWNIFSGFSTNRQKEAFKLANLRMQKDIAYAKEEQKNNIKFYKSSILAALSQIDSAKASLKSATIAFDTVAQKYLSQLVSYNTYLDALIMKYNAESTYIQSLNNYELQKANYIFYSGQMLLDYIN
ncbi:TolC family protein [Helicobacter sp. MIT 14-3879]|uniref:TolC family protein n=1 Tax=Helicobacter sp. MIT 14-3879 TaxID=2040649 RepID=UPI0015F1A17B|nr:TolC family protein [Helicobacter sp. MIT 14-3879]